MCIRDRDWALMFWSVNHFQRQCFVIILLQPITLLKSSFNIHPSEGWKLSKGSHKPWQISCEAIEFTAQWPMQQSIGICSEISAAAESFLICRPSRMCRPTQQRPTVIDGFQCFDFVRVDPCGCANALYFWRQKTWLSIWRKAKINQYFEKYIGIGKHI